jgi:hypothetical protein
VTGAKNKQRTRVPHDELEGAQRGAQGARIVDDGRDQSLQSLGEPNRERGRSPTFSDAAIQFCLSIKCLYAQPLRQALRMGQSLLRLAKLDWPVPDFSTVCRRQRTLQVELSYQPSKWPLR